MDRVTWSMLENKLKDLSSRTPMAYRLEHSGYWYTVYADNSRVCSANTKGKLYGMLEAISALLWIIERNK